MKPIPLNAQRKWRMRLISGCPRAGQAHPPVEAEAAARVA
jgi:hypothetical protein